MKKSTLKIISMTLLVSILSACNTADSLDQMEIEDQKQDRPADTAHGSRLT